MNKSDLIIKIANLNTSIYQKDATNIVNVFFSTITKALSKNERVELRGFGVFDVKKRNGETYLRKSQTSLNSIDILATPPNLNHQLFPFSHFPKSILYCLKKLKHHINRLNLFNGIFYENDVFYTISKLESKLKFTKSIDLKNNELKKYLENIKVEIHKLSNAVNKTYFEN